MDLSRRQIIIIGIAAVILVLVVALILLWQPTSDEQSKLSEDLKTEPQVFDSASVKTDETSKDLLALRLAARNFTERYLSFSNQNWGENIEAVRINMTKQMQEAADSELQKVREFYNADNFYGVSTKVLAERVTLNDKQGGELELEVQKVEKVGSKQNIIYKKYKIGLLKNNETWLVNTFREM